jgi:cobaltochelatase CobN
VTRETGGPLPLTPKISLLKVAARGDEHRILQVQGNLFVCSPANGNCCCGRPEKGRMAFENGQYEREWEGRRLRSRVHLTFSGCLGPCALGNNAMLQILGCSLWFKDLNLPALIPAVFDYIEQILATGEIVRPPPILANHIYDRYLPTAERPRQPPSTSGSLADPDEIARLDPVCLMDVDPATAQHHTEYRGRTVYFCAPSCKKLFLANPTAYWPG